MPPKTELYITERLYPLEENVPNKITDQDLGTVTD